MQNNDVASELRYFCCPKGNIHSGSLHGAESPETVLQRLMVNTCFTHIKKLYAILCIPKNKAG